MPPIISKIILLKGGFPKGGIKKLAQEILPEGRIMDRILCIEGYLHVCTVSTFYSAGWGLCSNRWSPVNNIS